ncbi:hypothetical protein F6X86_06745 [Enterococcus durans]|uniref:Uncharacterized protein n=1 Tax=Enterococcus durans TaxID=53345 RepID=A0A5N0YU73_9ENTE|nr:MULTISPECIES: hypothetical protein [Enterococcus]KAA9178928.1 hypothetical protein F6X86_06745 [Enterococcus durans]KAA9185503.1 hypothetical protein F6X85_07410 [Enterococcus durans]KAA9186657.1 hypothetical protein F6X90_06620 [Enterococcus durans]KAA9191462.1 hypothetical protein F6Y12_06505 [Enterococcus durans]KAA9193531.1 hypothetical protein F6X88_06660 [Enterococcus durans]
MSVSNLESFMSSGFITLLSFAVILLIFKHWRGAEWLKIGSVILIALILNDFATNQGSNIFYVIKWFLHLFGIQM